MNFFRWLSFWPVAIVSGVLASGAILILGDLLLGHWWLTGCLVIAASAVLQPVVTTLLAVIIAPRVNKFTVWSILLPFMPMYLSGVITIFALIFFGHEGSLIGKGLFEAVSPWWYSLSASLGWLYGVSFAWSLCEGFQEQQKLFDEYVETLSPVTTDSLSGGAAEAA